MKVILASSGAGGHLSPALVVADELTREGHEVFFLGSFASGIERIKNKGYQMKENGARGLMRAGFIDYIKFTFFMTKAFFVSLKFLTKFQPKVVFGFGGYGAFPVVASASLLGYPTIIHEQNVVPGRANSLLARFARKITISFKESAKYFNEKKVVLTGCPAHIQNPNENRDTFFKEFQLMPEKTTIFVLGGSQGSHRINEVFLQTAEELVKELDFQVIHVCGEKDYEGLKSQYAQLGIPIALYRFLGKIDYAYSIADCIISRAGAVTITEIAYFKVPSVLIPYPHARGHQRDNALILSQKNIALLIDEKDLNVQNLKEAILKQIKMKKTEHSLDKEIDEICIPDAAKRIVEEAVALV